MLTSFNAGDDVTKYSRDENFTQAAIGAVGTGITSYTSSDTAVAIVDSSTESASTTFSAPAFPGNYSLILTVTDEEGGSATATVTVSILEYKITASDGAADDLYGSYADLSEDGKTAIVGAYFAGNGDAYIYKWNGITWAETKLIASDGASNDSFGISAALSSNGETAYMARTFNRFT